MHRLWRAKDGGLNCCATIFLAGCLAALIASLMLTFAILKDDAVDYYQAHIFVQFLIISAMITIMVGGSFVGLYLAWRNRGPRGDEPRPSRYLRTANQILSQRSRATPENKLMTRIRFAGMIISGLKHPGNFFNRRR